MLGEQVEKFLVIPTTHRLLVTPMREYLWADCQNWEDSTPEPQVNSAPPRSSKMGHGTYPRVITGAHEQSLVPRAAWVIRAGGEQSAPGLKLRGLDETRLFQDHTISRTLMVMGETWSWLSPKLAQVLPAQDHALWHFLGKASLSPVQSDCDPHPAFLPTLSLNQEPQWETRW